MATFQDGLKDYVDVAQRISIFRENIQQDVYNQRTLINL